jgi:hypothetical protein
MTPLGPRARGHAGVRILPNQEKKAPRLRGEGQYSLASMMVSTRVVFAGSAGSSEPRVIVAS